MDLGETRRVEGGALPITPHPPSCLGPSHPLTGGVRLAPSLRMVSAVCLLCPIAVFPSIPALQASRHVPLLSKAGEPTQLHLLEEK